MPLARGRDKVPGPQIRQVLGPGVFAVPNWCKPFALEKIREEQGMDGDIRLIKEWCDDSKVVKEADVALSSAVTKHYWLIRARLCMIEGVLMFDSVFGRSLVVPKSMKRLILQSCHDSLVAGHLGSSKMISKVRRNFYWFRMYADCTQFVQACEFCTLLKSIKRKHRGLLGKFSCSCPVRKGTCRLVGPIAIHTDQGK